MKDGRTLKLEVVVVCTPGDSKVEVKENIKFSQKYECDIFVTATRTKGETTREMERFTNKKGRNVKKRSSKIL